MFHKSAEYQCLHSTLHLTFPFCCWCGTEYGEFNVSKEPVCLLISVIQILTRIIFLSDIGQIEKNKIK